MSKPELLNSEVAISNPWTKIVKEDLKFSSGNQGEYLIVEREMALMIIVLHLVDGQYFTYIVEQYRYPINQKIWQFPMGTNEEGKDMAEHAKQELKEETGLVVGGLIKVGEYFVDPGLSRQKCTVFIAEDVVSQGEQELEETEQGMIVKRVSLNELNQMVLNGLLADSWGYVANYFINEYLKDKLKSRQKAMFLIYPFDVCS